MVNLTGALTRFFQRHAGPAVAAMRHHLFPALLVLALAVSGLQHQGALDEPELLFYDLAQSLAKTPQKSSDICLIGATDEDLNKYGWPLPDGILAQALETLVKSKAAAVGVDLYRDKPIGAGAEQLNAVLLAGSNIVFAHKLSSRNAPPIAPPAVLRNTDKVGFADLAVDGSEMVRRALLFADEGEETAFGLGMRLSLLHLARKGAIPATDPSNPDIIRLGKGRLQRLNPGDGPYSHADTAGYQILINFHDSPGQFPLYTLGDLLEGRVPMRTLVNKVVVLGTTSQSVKDYFSLPTTRFGNAPPVYGIEVHARIISHLLAVESGRAKPLAGVSGWAEFFWMVCAGVLGALAGWRFRKVSGIVLAVLAGPVVILVLHYGLFLLGMWVSVTPVLLAYLGASGLVSAHHLQVNAQHKKQLMALFSRYFSRDISARIWESRAEVLDADGLPAPQQLVATIFFCDIVGFSGKAEVLAPHQLAGQLNAFFERAIAIIHRNGGSVDKLIGDAVMAVFGVPVPRRRKEEIFQDALQAVRSALELEEALTGLNRQFVEEGQLPFSVRIGIHTGPVVAGVFGSTERAEYTVMGDAVNVAARLENMEKGKIGTAAVCRILISETTRHCLDDSIPVRRLGEYRLQGKLEAVVVYQIGNSTRTGENSHVA